MNFKLGNIIAKNFKLLIRTKTSALIVILGPLLLVFLVSSAFNTSSLYDIKVGTYSSSYSELSNSLIEQLDKSEFKTLKIDSEENCVKRVKAGDVHICAVFPANLSVKTENSISFYVDKSRINLVAALLNSLSSQVSIKSSELSSALINTLVSSLENTNKKLNINKEAIASTSSSLVDIRSRVIDVNTNLSALNVNVTGLNITKLEEVTEGYNNSDLKALLGSFKILRSKINTILSARDTATQSLTKIKTGLESDINNIKNLDVAVKSIIEDINSIEVKETTKIVSPIKTEVKPIVAEKTHLSYIFPTLLVLIVLFVGIFLASTSVISEKESKAYFRNFITPTNNFLFIAGTYITTILIIIAQLIITFVVAILISKTQLAESVLINSFVLLFLLSSVFILLGMLIGYLFKSGETSNLASISLGCILLFFSNTILPLETLPTAIRQIASFNPFVIGEVSLKKILLFNESLNEVSISIFTLLVYIVILVVWVYLARNFTKRRVIT